MAKSNQNSSIGDRTRSKSPGPRNGSVSRKSSVKQSNRSPVPADVLQAGKKVANKQKGKKNQDNKTDKNHNYWCLKMRWIAISVLTWLVIKCIKPVTTNMGILGVVITIVAKDFCQELLGNAVQIIQKYMEEGVTPETRKSIAHWSFTFFRVLSYFTWLIIYVFFVQTQFCDTKTETQYIHHREGNLRWIEEIPSRDITVGYVDSFDFQCKIYLWAIVFVDVITRRIKKKTEHWEDCFLKSICNNICDYGWLLNVGLFMFYFMNYNTLKAPLGQKYPMCDSLPPGYERIDKPNYHWAELSIYSFVCFITSFIKPFCVPKNHSLLMYVVRYYNRGQHDIFMWIWLAY